MSVFIMLDSSWQQEKDTSWTEYRFSLWMPVLSLKGKKNHRILNNKTHRNLLRICRITEVWGNDTEVSCLSQCWCVFSLPFQAWFRPSPVQVFGGQLSSAAIFTIQNLHHVHTHICSVLPTLNPEDEASALVWLCTRGFTHLTVI